METNLKEAMEKVQGYLRENSDVLLSNINNESLQFVRFNEDKNGIRKIIDAWRIQLDKFKGRAYECRNFIVNEAGQGVWEDGLDTKVFYSLNELESIGHNEQTTTDEVTSLIGFMKINLEEDGTGGNGTFERWYHNFPDSKHDIFSLKDGNDLKIIIGPEVESTYKTVGLIHNKNGTVKGKLILESYDTVHLIGGGPKLTNILGLCEKLKCKKLDTSRVYLDNVRIVARLFALATIEELDLNWFNRLLTKKQINEMNYCFNGFTGNITGLKEINLIHPETIVDIFKDSKITGSLEKVTIEKQDARTIATMFSKAEMPNVAVEFSCSLDAETEKHSGYYESIFYNAKLKSIDMRKGDLAKKALETLYEELEESSEVDDLDEIEGKYLISAEYDYDVTRSLAEIFATESLIVLDKTLKKLYNSVSELIEKRVDNALDEIGPANLVYDGNVGNGRNLTMYAKRKIVTEAMTWEYESMALGGIEEAEDRVNKMDDETVEGYINTNLGAFKALLNWGKNVKFI